MKFVFSFLLVMCFYVVNAQDYTQLTLFPKLRGEILVLNKNYNVDNDTLQITNFKFYISDLRYFKNDSLVFLSQKKARLIDLATSSSLQIKENNSFEFDKITFNIGIDSLTNVSGVFEGDLDPTNGMYWTWQSGYINFKLEGTATHCPARNHKFNWHIGGYLEPFYAMREISLNCNSNDPSEIVIQLDELFKSIDISKVYQVMSPNETSLQIADVLPNIFKINSK